MTDFAIAPTERPPISSLGQTSSLCEKFGSDILWSSKHGMVGVQRKEENDLISSVRDGRLGREFQMMSSLKFRFLVIEGQPSWDREGNLMTQHTRWSLRQQWGVELSAQVHNVMVLKTRNAMETCSVVEYLAGWVEKNEHMSSLLARQGPPTNGWGKLTDRTSFVHVFSGLPGVSTELSGRIFDKWGNVLSLKVTKEQLQEVDGVGPKRAEAITKCLS